jgi:copper chaperone CopZ
MTEPIHFIVQQAGCESCAARVREALADIVAVEEVRVDEGAGVAAVRALASRDLQPAAVDAALAEASRGSGHDYRVSPGSWWWA